MPLLSSATGRCFAAHAPAHAIAPLLEQELALARQGLKRRNRLDRDGRDESWHLEPIEQIAADAQTPAEQMLVKYHGVWGGSVDPVYREYVF